MTVKWSAFASGSAISGSDISVGLQGGANVQWPYTSLATYFWASPTLVTPTLGVASATSINKVAITAPATSATLTIANGKTLTANASVTLAGTDGKTLTLSNNLTLAGTDGTTITFGSASSTFPIITNPAAATLQLGAADANVPVVQTLKAQSGLTGSGSDIGGPDLTIQPGLGTGFGTTATYGLGRVLFQTPVQKATGATIQTYAQVLAIGPQTITSATSNPVLDMAQVWNNAGLTATALKLNVTDTSSNAASLLADLQVASTSKFKVSKAGATTAASFIPNGSTAPASGIYSADAGGSVTFTSNSSFGAQLDSGITSFAINRTWSFSWVLNASQNPDLFLTRSAAASLQIGAADAATAVAQSLRVQSIVAGTADTAGANWTLKGSVSTGSATPGDIIFQTAGKGAASTVQNTLITALTIKGGTTNNTNVGFPSVLIGNAALATNATDGFLYIPTCAGTPTGTPTAVTGLIAMVYDTNNHQFWFYDSGWKQPKTPAAAAIITWQ